MAAKSPASEAGAPEIRNVLTLTDFSELGDRAIEYAYSVLPQGGTVHLVHFIEPPVVPNPLYAHYSPGKAPTPEERSSQVEEIERKLRGLIPPGSSRGIRTEVEVLESNDVAIGICELADRLNADLICMASHGRTGLVKALFGSVAQGVLTCTHRPVLVIRPPLRSPVG
jgi:nucleotide-binding universal stress UspA family protein